ncbi:MAG: 3-phosphoshikimate 1-carboxyvinyltransferase [Vicinamibacterales bacterium]|nr:3-phosphoshikimate 1-carboxyvinyltransferase [Vicinamibacterales bacterium]
MSVADQTVVRPARAVRGTLRVPGDKSISHRYAMLAALARGRSTITGYSGGGDCASTLACLAALGVGIARGPDGRVVVDGPGRLRPAAGPLDAGNSGSTMRMLAGVLAAQPFTTTMVGDASLSRRPMRRVMTPLTLMGARCEAAEGDRPPLTIHGAALHGIAYTPEVPSAQIKSAVLLAGLQASGTTTITEPAPTRDHTERALRWFGASLTSDGPRIAIVGGQTLQPADCRVPGDPSAAAFWAIAAAGLPGSAITIEDVGLNPTRLALVDVLRRAGADLTVAPTDDWQGEPVGQLRIVHRGLRAFEVTPDEVPGVIDELPALAALATLGGAIRVTGASELRVKESDRITALVDGLRRLGADAEELPDGFVVQATRPLTGGSVDAHGDHRLAMAFAIAALGATGETAITGAGAAAVSYPAFFATLDSLRA